MAFRGFFMRSMAMHGCGLISPVPIVMAVILGMPIALFAADSGSNQDDLTIDRTVAVAKCEKAVTHAHRQGDRDL